MDIPFLYDVTASIEYSFLAIAAVLLCVEFFVKFLKQSLTGKDFIDVFVSVSTQLPFTLVMSFGYSIAYGVYLFIEKNYIAWTFKLNLLTIIVAVIVGDFICYWEHRIAHQIRLLWLSHAVHHSSIYFNIVIAFRMGPFEGIWQSLTLLPMIFVGFSADLAIIGVLIVRSYEIWVHNELVDCIKPLNRVMLMPSHHRVHHGYNPQYVDKNYGAMFVIWDRIFGTFEEEKEKLKYGLVRDFNSVNPITVWFSEFPQFFSRSLLCEEFT